MKVQKILNEILVQGLVTLTFLLPLFFLPITSNFYVYNKNILLIVFVVVLWLVSLARMAVAREIKLVKTPFDLPLVLLAAAYLAATLIGQTNRFEILFAPGATGTIIALVLFYFLLTHNIVTAQSKKLLLYALLASGSLLSLIAIYQYVGVGASLTSTPWLKAKNWTPTGSSLGLALFLATLFPIAIVNFFKSIQKSIVTAGIFGLSSALLAIGAIVTISLLLPGSGGNFFLLPYPTAWAIAVETLKQHPLLGVGPSNFLSAFTRFRPVAFNALPYWTARFGESANYPLQLLTETGILGLASFALLTIVVIKNFRRFRSPLSLAVASSLFLLFVLPANFVPLFAFITLLALWTGKTEEKPIDIAFLRQFTWTPLVLGLLIAGGILFYTAKVYSAETSFKKSLDALAKNDGIATYNFQIAAIKGNPRSTDYRLAYAQTNFALADALSRKENLTDQEKNNITQLVQQAINEAKIATALNPTSPIAWENLSLLYRNLINFAQGADQWTIAAYRQTIALDPVNPQLRLALGGVFFGLKNYDLAIRQFENAIDLKPDYANAYYNLSASYRELQKYAEAYQAMQITLSAIPADSADYQQALKELNELAKKLPANSATGSAKPATKPEESISVPEPLPSPAISPIELPENSAPEVSPVPSETPTPQPTTQP